MRDGIIAFVAGLAGGGITLYFLVDKKTKDLKATAAAIERAVSTNQAAGNPQAALLIARARSMTLDLKQYAEAKIEKTAKEAAEGYIADVYGLTAERIAGINRLAARLGV